MYSLINIEPDHERQWDEFVCGHPFGQIYHQSGWKRILERSFPHIKGNCLALCNSPNRDIVAGLPLYGVDSWVTGKRLVSAPFATLFDPLISDARQLRTFLDEIIRRIHGSRFSFAEIRTLNSGPFFGDSRFSRSSCFKHHYLELNVPLDKLRSGFHRTCIRQRISRGEKSGLIIKLAEDENDLMEFYRLLILTRKKLALFSHPYRFVKAIWEEFHPSGNAQILLAQKDGKAIGALLLFVFKERMSVESSASDESCLNLSPIHLLFWEALKLAYEKKLKVFDFGRTSCQNESLLDFKRRWGTQEVDITHFYYPAERALNENTRESGWKYRAVKMIASLRLPNTLYTLLGNILYRHMG